jgi:hypothetical protein
MEHLNIKDVMNQLLIKRKRQRTMSNKNRQNGGWVKHKHYNNYKKTKKIKNKYKNSRKNKL